ncbi:MULTISPECIES: photosystem I reaction centre subunit III [Moorena]|uniref:Photosystem I reaction center subunit III n=1 Tax=Moorena producens 3L TaxID=489825 RepID=F4XWS9_9CYAN|nr:MULTISPECIES: photosystem I reaction centre subunit III [Moorena]NES85064.1 Photosystem I reaction center subunit III [Moorena sp. SIO2B7]EGJ30814.1 photosystem I reaction centre subunit III [Moorena producens 3L]NEP30277.1 Photosystem I reaction center subunit III [Moorena sp. SIO3B2]NEP69227.1 Photosystem I reaction center subunit III [Moorena sp. SIO3A5]NEQ06223.1 Photosystem I reaction center subunit III [Moorena sp. SIO4E2]
MRRLLALIFAVSVWLCAISPASASLDHLTPCSESAAFQARKAQFLNTTGDPNSGANRFERYSQALCGDEGYPHLIVDGRFSHMGDFLIPSLLFLYITGWIGWAGRSYLQAIQKGKNPEEKEVIIDVPVAFSKMLMAASWPLLAFKEITTGEMFAKDDEIPVSPR